MKISQSSSLATLKSSNYFSKTLLINSFTPDKCTLIDVMNQKSLFVTISMASFHTFQSFNFPSTKKSKHNSQPVQKLFWRSRMACGRSLFR